MKRKIFENLFFSLVILALFSLASGSNIGTNLTSAQEQNRELLQIGISEFPNNNVRWQVVGDVAWDPEGERLAISLYDRIVIWNRSTLAFEAELTDPYGGIGFSQALWSSDGSLLAGTQSGREFVYVWNMSLEQPELIEVRGMSYCEVFSMSWHPDRLVLAIVNLCGDLYMWDASTRQGEPQLVETSEHEVAVQWNPAGSQLALMTREPRIIQLRDAETFAIMSELAIEENSNIEPIAIIDWIDENILIAGLSPTGGDPNEGQFQFVSYIWNTETGEESSSFEPNVIETVVDSGWDARGNYLAVGGFANQTVVIWDTQSGSTVSTIDLGADIWTIEWHPTEPQLAIARRDGKIAIWEIANLVPE